MSPSENTDRRLAYQKVSDALLDDFRCGVIKPGDQLPNEAELGVRFDVSRSTIREALRLLSSQNLVVTSRGASGGSFMAQPDLSLVSDSFSSGIEFLAIADELSVADLLEARELLEVPAVRLTAARRTPEQLAELHELTHNPSVEEGSFRFHTLLLESAHNPMLLVMTRPVFEVLRNRFLRDLAPNKFWTEVEHDHRGIFNAIEAGDPEAAAAEMTLHLRHLRKTYLDIDSRN